MGRRSLFPWVSEPPRIPTTRHLPSNRQAWRASAIRYAIDSLERRLLLAGVTLITHGYEFTNGLFVQPTWLYGMEVSLGQRLGGASVYRMTIGPNGLPGGAQVNSFQRVVTGPTNNAESIIDVDWSAVSDPFTTLNPVWGARSPS